MLRRLSQTFGGLASIALAASLWLPTSAHSVLPLQPNDKAIFYAIQKSPGAPFRASVPISFQCKPYTYRQGQNTWEADWSFYRVIGSTSPRTSDSVLDLDYFFSAGTVSRRGSDTCSADRPSGYAPGVYYWQAVAGVTGSGNYHRIGPVRKFTVLQASPYPQIPTPGPLNMTPGQASTYAVNAIRSRTPKAFQIRTSCSRIDEGNFYCRSVSWRTKNLRFSSTINIWHSVGSSGFVGVNYAFGKITRKAIRR